MFNSSKLDFLRETGERARGQVLKYKLPHFPPLFTNYNFTH